MAVVIFLLPGDLTLECEEDAERYQLKIEESLQVMMIDHNNDDDDDFDGDDEGGSYYDEYLAQKNCFFSAKKGLIFQLIKFCCSTGWSSS